MKTIRIKLKDFIESVKDVRTIKCPVCQKKSFLTETGIRCDNCDKVYKIRVV